MIWVVGSEGMLGRELVRFFEEKGMDCVGSGREVSVLDVDALRAFTADHNPRWIVNCSAYTDVDGAESESEKAFALNRDGVANLAAVAAERVIPLIHISTDYVFDGTSDNPLDEEAPTGPAGEYGKSKLAGEKLVAEICPKHFIVRTSWLYGEYGSNFVGKMIRLMDERESVRVVDDQTGSPTWTKDLAGFIAAIIESDSDQYGTYNYSGEGQCSWHEFAREIYRLGRECGLIKSECRVLPCSSDEYAASAGRPAYSLLSKEKAKRVFGVEVPQWRAALECFVSGMS